MLWHTTADDKYRIESLTATSFHSALRVIKNALCQDEVVNIASGVNKNPIAVEELLEVCAYTALDGVSLVAIENSTKEVVAVAFNKIQVKSSDSSEKPFFEMFAEKRTQDSSRSLIHFMADVDQRCNLFEKYGVDCSLEIMFLATLKEHRYNKLGTLLCKYSIEVAKKYRDGAISPITVEDFGPKYTNIEPRKPFSAYPKICQAIYTTIGSQKIGKKLNFTVNLTVPLSEVIFNGKSCAERLGDASLFYEVVAFAL